MKYLWTQLIEMNLGKNWSLSRWNHKQIKTKTNAQNVYANISSANFMEVYEMLGGATLFTDWIERFLKT